MAHFDIEKLRKGHEAIVATISRIQQVARSFSSAQSLFPDLEEELFANWKRHDQVFFEEILQHYQQDREVTKLLEFFQHDMKDIKIQYLLFMDRFQDNPDAILKRNFPKEFKVLSDLIIKHLEMEEEYIYPLLGKMT